MIIKRFNRNILLLLFIIFFLKTYAEEGCVVNNTFPLTGCKYCKSGYGYDETTQTCSKCSKGEYSKGGRTPCRSCSTFGFCSSLEIHNETQNQNEREIKCPYFSENEGSEMCEYCPIGKYVDLERTNCFECPSFCLECESGLKGGKCIRCQRGFGFDEKNQKCVECDKSKGEYSNGTTKCLSRKNNNVFLYVSHDEDNGDENELYTFNYCAENCKICHGQECIECVNGTTLNKETNTCQGTVLQVDTNEENECKKRKENERVIIGEKCFKCEDITQHCSECSIVDENKMTLKCTKCQEPFILQNGMCIPCSRNKHYENGECKMNKPGCVHQIGNTCFECSNGLFLTNGRCIVQKNCDIVSDSTCDKCTGDNSLTTNGICSTSQNCVYTKDKECLVCQENYQVNQQNNQCVNFTNCLRNREEYCLKTEDTFLVNMKNGKLIDCGTNNGICIAPHGEDVKLYPEIKNKIDLKCGNDYYMGSNKVLCKQSNKIKSTGELDNSIQSKCIKTNNSDCIQCAKGYYLYEGECILIENENCLHQTYNHCNNYYKNCDERKQKDQRLQYCLECDIQKDGNKYALYNGKCKSFETIASEMGCETFDTDKTKSFNERCKCKTNQLLDYFGCENVITGCSNYAFHENKCYQCGENQYQWIDKCYTCSHNEINNYCFLVNDKENIKQSIKTIEEIFDSSEESFDESSDETNSENKEGITIEEGDISSCYTFGNSGCVRCFDGFILNNGKCKKCVTNKCSICGYVDFDVVKNDSNTLNINNYQIIDEKENLVEKCFVCDNKYTLDDNNCIDNEVLNNRCDTMIPGGGCAICKDGYYRIGSSCQYCDKSCETCSSLTMCSLCTKDYFRDEISLQQSQLCIPFSNLTNCLKKTQEGCESCENGYWLDTTRCKKCHTNCTSCSSQTVCSACSKGFVFLDKYKTQCVNYTDIPHCTSIGQESTCGSCQEGYQLTEDKFGCEEIQLNYIVIIGVPASVVFVICIILIILIVILSFVIKSKKQRKALEEQIAIFKISHSNIKFEKIHPCGIVCNKKEIDFNLEMEDDENDLDVDSLHEICLCIGYTGKGKSKIQITSKENSDRIEIDFEPNLIQLKSGTACEFHMNIIPLCTMNYEDDISISALILETGETIVVPLKFKLRTKLSSKLNPDELIEEKKLGEGSFGVVFLGTYRGNKVAIKKMKEIGVQNILSAQQKQMRMSQLKRSSIKQPISGKYSKEHDSDDSNKPKEILEFEKEVAMLDKFRNEYVIHFYGAVMIPGKICMVTELAEYGSLENVIFKSNLNISEFLKVKLMLDGAYGIKYLHDNGILHRDIKPDNFLVVSISENIPVNCKLTDFGASRNINMMMTNMTFTKGIGTPAYMAPEILNRQHYKMEADIYSFAITMMEIYSQKQAFPKVIFQYPWSIADFISCGKRPDLEDIDCENIKTIIKRSWNQNPKDRAKINEIVSFLDEEYQKRKSKNFGTKQCENNMVSDDNDINENENDLEMNILNDF